MKRALACSTNGYAQVEIDAGGHLLVAAGAARRGRSGAPCQYDLLLASLAACTALTLRQFAASRQWPLASLDVYLALEQGASGMRVERRLLMTGLDIERQAILLELAGLTPLTLLLGAGMSITTVLV